VTDLPASNSDVGSTPEPAVSWTVPPAQDATSAVALWTPKGIGWASVLLGFPGAAILAALNWHRMGATRKGLAHLVGAIVATYATISLPVPAIGIWLGVAWGYYLYRAQRSDQATFPNAGRVVERNGLAGALIAIAGTLLIVAGCVTVADTLAQSTIQHRGEVLFGTRPGSDLCTPAAQAIVFGPEDSIFLVATMRETVRVGSRVVEVIDGPSGTGAPVLIDAEPPFDCLGTSDPWSPPDQGTYVVHFRYEGQPTTPDLARGTFTIMVGPVGSASSPAASAP
jgi:hypothetical protein